LTKGRSTRNRSGQGSEAGEASAVSRSAGRRVGGSAGRRVGGSVSLRILELLPSSIQVASGGTHTRPRRATSPEEIRQLGGDHKKKVEKIHGDSEPRRHEQADEAVGIVPKANLCDAASTDPVRAYPMPTRLSVVKTCKLFVNGAFPRSESGRSLPVLDQKGGTAAQIAHASRKDLRDAVEAANAAQPKWAAATAYNRGQIVYRIAEMMEARQLELVDAIRVVEGTPIARAKREVEQSIDRVVRFAGWADKLLQTLGNQNPVAGPFYTFTVPEPVGVVAVVAPDRPSLLSLATLACNAIVPGNACVVVASDANPLPAVAFGEILATSDVPAGVVNLLTGRRAELLEHIANHRDIHAISAAALDAAVTRTLRTGAAENCKRIQLVTDEKPDWTDDDRFAAPWSMEPLMDMKTIWHPCAS
jgi:hypothetical protein